MTRALDLAWRGWGRVHPNPLVGAVVIRDGASVGEGYHAEYGERHAETSARASAGDRARGATVVVTLEPCAHHGKQPPCTDALIRAGVGRVVVALEEPTPLAGGGAARLRSAGIDVETGLCAHDAAAQNAIFLHRARRSRRPFVALKLATSIDARIADVDRKSRWLSGPAARDYVQWLRAGFDAIAVGGATARDDDPSLTVRGAVVPRVPPRRVVFAAALNVSGAEVLVRTARDVPTTIVTAPELIGSARGRALADAGVRLLGATTIEAGLEALAADGIGSILVEGGGRLAGAMLRANTVDRLYWLQAPLWLGEQGVSAFADMPSPVLDHAERWHPVERRGLGPDTLLVLDRTCSPAS
ncbi:MAG: bifunctional diaminohydroxyphosphoribosylaminopyrimidine deaminase/5-amino-6-(5-phosphoribosylamino)uracil reductase RibD [Gemmatimonadales bacterium]|nr:bifunctional diaminohydroxyphosphoribosylaminopyrimidine deaminase/5-amino-6-(5-phosphoribosylamino)uracil reductase RibD [Gemmatimonadales bacterium]